MPRAGKGPGLVLCQEIFGANETMRSAAENFAEEGYVVLVPDLFWRQQPGVELGYTPEDWNRAFELAQGFDEARSEEHTSELPSLKRIAYDVFRFKTKTIQ